MWGVGGGGWGYAARLFILFSFPCSADHERDWSPCKVVFFGLATNTLNERKNNKNKPAHLHTQAESGAYLRDSSRVPRRRPFIQL